eukprot:jgi/Psemu1/314496/fgenesh1_kg.1554_\
MESETTQQSGTGTATLSESHGTEMMESTSANPSPSRRKKPVKPALKRTIEKESFSPLNHNDLVLRMEGDSKPKAATKKKKKKNRTLKWDEAKIQEHDQLRGTRMKIEEANTPFAYYDSGSETDGSFNSARASNKPKQKSGGISWDALTNKLEAHAAVVQVQVSPSSSVHYSTDEDVATEHQKREHQRQELKRLEFQEHRKRHYNEMEVLRRFRRDHPDGEPTSNGHSAEMDDNELRQRRQHEQDYDENDGDDENE